MGGIPFDLVCYIGDSVGSVTKSDSFRRQVKYWGFDTFFELGGKVMIDIRSVRYCTYVDFSERSIFFEKLKFTYVGFDISTECTFGSATFCE